MKRREFMAVIGGAAITWPLGVRAQSTQKLRRIAFVHSGLPVERITETGGTFWIRRFYEELRALGHTEGTNLMIERLSAGGNTGRFAAVAADVVSAGPEVIVSNSSEMVRTLMTATRTIPIVGIFGDPITGGLVLNLARPGGNLTGVSIDGGPGIPAKRLQILKETVPGAAKIVYLISAGAEVRRSIVPVAHKVLADVSEAQLRGAFAEMADDKVDAVLMSENGSFVAMRAFLAALAAQHRIPVIYAYREFAEAGGLMAYGPELGHLAKRMADDVHQILNGAKPGDIPIDQPTKYEMVLNLKTAKALSLAIPQAVLAQADEVIE
jgi:putative tryptophan/tyrosine transport system substrate-binding protein